MSRRMPTREEMLVSVVRSYLAEHDRTSSEDNPKGRRCYCTICRFARQVVTGARGAALAVVYEVVNELLDRIGGRRA